MINQHAQLPDLNNEIERTLEDIKSEDHRGVLLSKELEDPECSSRWKLVGGTLPSEDFLLDRLKTLNDMISDSQRKIIQKNIEIEKTKDEVKNTQDTVSKYREESRPMLNQFNSLQWKIKSINHKLMATVSELSMHQATTTKLREEEKILVDKIDQARMLIDDNEGTAPSEKALCTLNRLLSARWAKDKNKESKIISTKWRYIDSSKVNKFDSKKGESAQVTIRTSAELRPTAYIPNESLGIPKPVRTFKYVTNRLFCIYLHDMHIFTLQILISMEPINLSNQLNLDLQ